MDELRKQARRLENSLDAKLVQFSRCHHRNHLCQNPRRSFAKAGSAPCSQTVLEALVCASHRGHKGAIWVALGSADPPQPSHSGSTDAELLEASAAAQRRHHSSKVARSTRQFPLSVTSLTCCRRSRR